MSAYDEALQAFAEARNELVAWEQAGSGPAAEVTDAEDRAAQAAWQVAELAARERGWVR